MKKERLLEITNLSLSVISEQASSDEFIKIADGIDITKLTEGDNNPLFITVEVIHEGVSRNYNYYDREAIEELYKQILDKKPNAYQGHLDIKDVDSKNPNAKTIWIGAGMKEIEGKLTLFAKGYILPENKNFRGYIKRAVAAGKRLPVSIYGLSKRVYDSVKKVYRVTEIDLQSIDWAREFAEGVKSLTGTPKLTSEMTDYNNLLDSVEMKYEDITIEDLTKNRPDLVQEIKQNSELETVVSEMSKTLNVEPSNILTTIQEQTKALDTTKARLSEMRTEFANISVRKVLQEHISDDNVRLVVDNVISRGIKESLSEMINGEDNLDESKIKEAVMEQMKTPEVKALLRTKVDSSVPAVPHSTNNSGKLTKVVKKQ